MVGKGQHFKWEAKVSLLVFGKVLLDRVNCAKVLGTRMPGYYRSRESACVARTKCLIETVVWKVLGGRV